MKTFEERYTAWIDGKLEGPALTSFELELSRRASAGEARADKENAARLHQLLTTHLAAPTMTNVEFFSHQLRERIEAERSSGRRRDEARSSSGWLFSWPFARLAGLGAAGLFVAVALYYGMVPTHQGTMTGPEVAVNQPAVRVDGAPAVPAATPEAPTAPRTMRSPGDEIWAKASPTPPPVDLNGGDIQVLNVPPSPNNTSATPLQLKDPNVNVLWINGLDYMSNVPGESPASNGAPAPASGGGKP